MASRAVERQTADALAGTQKQLKVAQLARQDALNAERKWRYARCTRRAAYPLPPPLAPSSFFHPSPFPLASPPSSSSCNSASFPPYLPPSTAPPRSLPLPPPRGSAQLVETTEKGATLTANASAAAEALEDIARRLARADAANAALNGTLASATTAATAAEAEAAAVEAKRRALSTEVEALSKRALERQGELDGSVARAVSCEARVAEEWKGQKECAKAVSDLSACEARYATQHNLTETAQAEATHLRAQAAGKAVSDESARSCATARAKATEELATVSAAHFELQREAEALRKSEAEANTAAGTAAEAKRLTDDRLRACRAEAAATAKRLAAEEAALVELGEQNATCALELRRYTAFARGTGVSALTRFRVVVVHLLRSDWAMLAAATANAARAMGAAVRLVTAHRWYELSAQLSARIDQFSSALDAQPPPPTLVDLPMAARPAVYGCAMLLVLLLCMWLQLRAARTSLAARSAQLAQVEARLEALYEVTGLPRPPASAADALRGGAPASASGGVKSGG